MKDDTDDLSLTTKIIMYAAATIWVVWYISTGEERGKESKRSALFCNPATAVCVDDPYGDKREAWNDALRSASGREDQE